MSRRLVCGGLCACAATLASVVARAQEPPSINVECAQAYEEGQVARKSGRLMSARATLQACARDECPEFIRADCATWYGEVQSEVPTVVFAARSEGRDLVDVSVSLADRGLTSRIDGQAIELDPGEYDVRFEAPGMQPRAEHFVIVRGERNRLVQVDLVPVAPPKRVESALPFREPESRSLLVPGIFASVGAAGVAGFAVLALSGRSAESRLEDTCAPHCSHDEIADVRSKYLIADVSLGVGVASLAIGAYFLFSESSRPVATRAPAFDVRASSRGASFVYGGRF